MESEYQMEMNKILMSGLYGLPIASSSGLGSPEVK